MVKRDSRASATLEPPLSQQGERVFRNVRGVSWQQPGAWCERGRSLEAAALGNVAEDAALQTSPASQRAERLEDSGQRRVHAAEGLFGGVLGRCSVEGQQEQADSEQGRKTQGGFRYSSKYVPPASHKRKGHSSTRCVNDAARKGVRLTPALLPRAFSCRSPRAARAASLRRFPVRRWETPRPAPWVCRRRTRPRADTSAAPR